MDAAADDFMAGMRQAFETGLKLKSRMIERGLDRAQTKCPRCGGRIDAILAGPKKHIHMSCRTPSCIQMME